jgi:cytochrome c biogenesis protein CcmG, thiol:disulfide interchange protein DsbE
MFKQTCIALAFILTTWAARAQTTSLPNIKVRDMKGNEVFFNSLFPNTGDTTYIVSFWATWCGPCIKELEAIEEKLEDWQKSVPIKVMAISVDDARTAGKVKSFVKGRGWEFIIYQDENNDLKRALNIPNVPHTLVVKNGKLLFQHDGYVPGNELFEKIRKEYSR